MVDGGWVARSHMRWFRLLGAPGFAEDDINPRPRPDSCLQREKEPAFELERRKDGRPDVDTICLSIDATFGSLEDDASAVGMTVYGIKAGAGSPSTTTPSRARTPRPRRTPRS